MESITALLNSECCIEGASDNGTWLSEYGYGLPIDIDAVVSVTSEDGHNLRHTVDDNMLYVWGYDTIILAYAPRSI